MKFYHATNTGPNLEILKSFLQHGVKTEQSTGLSREQGAGFYVWTTKEKAIYHAFEHLDNSANGYMLIITVEADLNPKDWDLDYEVHPNLILTFIYNNFELFKQIPDGAIVIGGKPLKPSQCMKNEEPRAIGFVIGYGKRGIGFSSEGDPRDANVLGAIFNYMQIHFPAQAEKFEAELLKQEIHAVKYVGKAPLKIVAYEAFVDNKWIDALTLLEK